MPSILRSSAGTTTLPNWSIRRAVPMVLTSVPPLARPSVPTRKGLPAWTGWANKDHIAIISHRVQAFARIGKIDTT